MRVAFSGDFFSLKLKLLKATEKLMVVLGYDYKSLTWSKRFFFFFLNVEYKVDQPYIYLLDAGKMCPGE